ncbi:MAG: glycosyltransferase [Coriobacteriales bacterium]|nr:glycosyltransferase [Coriobacteriales bacterium]
MFVHISYQYFEDGLYHIKGWAAPKIMGDDIDFLICDNVNNIELNTLEMEYLPEVVQLFYQAQEKVKCGFTLSFKINVAKDWPLLIKSKNDLYDYYQLNLDTAFQVRDFNKMKNPLRRAKRYVFAQNRQLYRNRKKFIAQEDYYQAYPNFRESHKPSMFQLRRQAQTKFKIEPLISILVPLYKPNIEHFKAMVRSVLKSSYKKYELVLVNSCPDDTNLRNAIKHFKDLDKHVVVYNLPCNEGIAGNTNRALDYAKGDWIALLDQDDLISADALYCNVKAINENNNACIIYSDEDKISDKTGLYSHPSFKPDYSPVYLHVTNYFCHLLLVKTDLARKVGGLRQDFDGAQDYDFVLRCVSNAHGDILHIPKVLYSWRKHEKSTASNYEAKSYARDAGLACLQQEFDRHNADVVVEASYMSSHYKFQTQKFDKEKVGLILSFSGNNYEFKHSLSSILRQEWRNPVNFTFIVPASNNYLKNYINNINLPGNFTVVETPDSLVENSLNYFKNKAARLLDVDFLIFIDSKVELKDINFFQELFNIYSIESTAIVGPKYLYRQGNIYSCGLAFDKQLGAHNILQNALPFLPAYMCRANVPCNVSAILPDCFMIKKDVFEMLNGFDLSYSSGLYALSDLCLRAKMRNLLTAVCPYSQAYSPLFCEFTHDFNKFCADEYTKDILILQNAHGKSFKYDEYVNPNFNQQDIHFAL